MCDFWDSKFSTFRQIFWCKPYSNKIICYLFTTLYHVNWLMRLFELFVCHINSAFMTNLMVQTKLQHDKLLSFNGFLNVYGFMIVFQLFSHLQILTFWRKHKNHLIRYVFIWNFEMSMDLRKLLCYFNEYIALFSFHTCSEKNTKVKTYCVDICYVKW